jgi:phage terminase small subunit
MPPAKPAQLKLLTGRRPGVDAGGRKVNKGRGRAVDIAAIDE